MRIRIIRGGEDGEKGNQILKYAVVEFQKIQGDLSSRREYKIQGGLNPRDVMQDID